LTFFLSMIFHFPVSSHPVFFFHTNCFLKENQYPLWLTSKPWIPCSFFKCQCQSTTDMFNFLLHAQTSASHLFICKASVLLQITYFLPVMLFHFIASLVWYSVFHWLKDHKYIHLIFLFNRTHVQCLTYLPLIHCSSSTCERSRRLQMLLGH
jgi:hypothetical protein